MQLHPELADNEGMDFSMSWLLSELLVGCLGMGIFMYGKKMSRLMPLLVGGAMFVYPFFIGSQLVLWGVTAALCVLLFVMREK